MLVYHDFFCYSDPDQSFLKWIRIRIRPNDMDPTGSGSVSGSETLRANSWKVLGIHVSLVSRVKIDISSTCP